MEIKYPIREIAASYIGTEPNEDEISEIENEKSIKDLLKSASLTKIELGALQNHAVRPVGTFVPLKLLKETIQITPTADTEFSLGSTHEVVFYLFNEFYYFKAIVHEVSEGRVGFLIPKKLIRFHKRKLDRFILKSKKRIKAVINEISGRRAFMAEVTDISPKGIGLFIPGENDRVVDCESNIIIQPKIPGVGKMDEVSAKVVHWTSTDQGIHLGVSCSIPLALGEKKSLEDYLLEKRYPNVIRAKSDKDYHAIWEIMQSAFETSTSVDPTKKESAILTWKKASWSPQPLNRIYVLQSTEDKESIGTLAVSRYYNQSWLIHQLAVDGSKGQVLSHQLYGRVLDYLRHTNDAKYAIGTWPRSARVFQKYYVDFINQDSDRSAHYLEESTVFHFYVDKTLKELESTSSNIRVREFSYKDQGVLLKHLRKNYPEVFLKGQEFSEYNMLLEQVGELYSRISLERSRRILVAYDDESIVGFSVVEWGSEDQNVFNLFDSFRTFVIKQQESKEVYRQLLRETMKVYQENGKQHAVSWVKNFNPKDLSPSVELFGEAYYWIADGKRMKAFLRHLDRLHGRMGAIRSARAQ